MAFSRIVIASIMLGTTIAAGPSGAQVIDSEGAPKPAPVAEAEGDSIPAPTTMALLATSLAGLFLAGIHKRRKG